tara:strand:- start:238 stop:360 length:123 start_codon:yes stop_codon:yes gene_type:complete
MQKESKNTLVYNAQNKACAKNPNPKLFWGAAETAPVYFFL